MNKIFLVIQREYSTRVKKPSFWILTLVVPILLAALYAIPIMLATKPMEHANVLVVDDSGLFQGQFRSGRDITYFEMPAASTMLSGSWPRSTPSTPSSSSLPERPQSPRMPSSTTVPTHLLCPCSPT